MRILALDLATKTGWACHLPGRGEEIFSGVQDFNLKRGESQGMRWVRFTRWLQGMLADSRPHVVVYERPHHRGGAPTEVAVGFATHLQSTIEGWNEQHLEHQIEYAPCHTATLKKFATGKGNASKKAMIDAFIRKFNRRPIDDNEADAVWHPPHCKDEFGGVA